METEQVLPLETDSGSGSIAMRATELEPHSRMPFTFIWLRPFRVQKEDTEENKVGGTSVLNKQNIYIK